MKIKLLVATSDKDYAERLSGVLTDRFADTFDLSVCSSKDKLDDLLAKTKFDAALVEPDLIKNITPGSVSLPLILMDESETMPEGGLKPIRKYQRVSVTAGNILESYAETGKGAGVFDASRARITVVWSPAGGCGKTTVALAIAANKTLAGKQAVYLSLENFSGTSAFFQETGRSISKAFEKLDTNVSMLLAGIRQQDSGSGIMYFCSPENYDDINILSDDDIATLIDACTRDVDDLIIDLPSQCDVRIQSIFEKAATLALVVDASPVSQVKMKQFATQHNVFEQIKDRAVLICNKSAGDIGIGIEKTVSLPFIQGNDPVSVFKSLSGGNFNF